MQLGGYLEGGPLLWILPLYLHVNQKSNDDGLKNKFKTALVNEPTVFKPLKLYCNLHSKIITEILILTFHLPYIEIQNFSNIWTLKVNGCTQKGSNSIFIFAAPSNGGSTLKGKNLLLKEQILSFMSRLFWMGFVAQENMQRVMKVVRLCKTERKTWKYNHTCEKKKKKKTVIFP